MVALSCVEIVKGRVTPEQREARRSSLGASEIAAVAGIDPFRGRGMSGPRRWG